MLHLILIVVNGHPYGPRVCRHYHIITHTISTYRIRMSFECESFLKFYRTIYIDVELIGQSKHVTGRAKFGQVTARDGELSPRLQTFCVHELKLHFSRERSN